MKHGLSCLMYYLRKPFFCNGSNAIKMFVFFNSTTGEHDLNRLEGYEQNMTIDKIIKHPQYDASSNHDYDVAMIKLKNPIKYNTHVRPVCLAKTDFDTGTNCFISGWGHTTEGGEIPQVRKERRGIRACPHFVYIFSVCKQSLVGDFLESVLKCPYRRIFFLFLSDSMYHPMNFCERKIRFG